MRQKTEQSILALCEPITLAPPITSNFVPFNSILALSDIVLQEFL